MNSYRGISPFIVSLTKKYAQSLYCQFSGKIDLEDLQQDLMITAIQSLEKFNPRLGFIQDFVSKCLSIKSKEIIRNLQRQRRKVFFNTYQLEIIQQCRTEQDAYTLAEINNLLEFLPKGLRAEFEHKYSNPRKNWNNPVINTIRKILSTALNEEEKKKMKNISCIETLSVRELSKLSETDLHDLSEKISETHNWIKQLVEKFELALTTKYSEEAKKKLRENGTDFGTCKLKRNGFVVSVQLPKKVQWNQEILEDIYNKTDSDIRKDIFKVTFSIDEKQFAKLGKIMIDAVTPARSTSYGKLKISINRDGDTK